MIPTYKRPLRLMALVDSAMKNADDVSRLRFCFCVNRKDAETESYINGRYWPNEAHIEVIHEDTDQPNLSLYFNLMYKHTRFQDALVSELGDDMVFLTKGWDTRVLDEVNKGEGRVVVYCNDNYIAHEKCCVNLFTTRALVEAMKKPFMCEFFHADMIDVIWTLTGTATGTLRYLPDVLVQHNHSTKKKPEDWDETFKRLSPVQKAANGPGNQKLALSYAMLCARNLIEEGIGKWNILA